MNRRRRQDGFTLVELLVTVSLLMVVLVPTLLTLLRAQTGTNDLRKLTEARALTRAAMDQMTRDLRQAQRGGPTLPPVLAISGDGLTFLSPDKSTPMRLRKITYAITTTGTLTRSQVSSTNSGSAPWTFPATTPVAAVVTTGVKAASSSFVGRAGDGAVTTDPEAVVRVDLTLVVNGLTRDSAAQTYVQSIDIRSAG